jgi:hypothetical protein
MHSDDVARAAAPDDEDIHWGSDGEAEDWDKELGIEEKNAPVPLPAHNDDEADDADDSPWDVEEDVCTVPTNPWAEVVLIVVC